MKDYYTILELSTSCTEDEIRHQYRRLAMRWHPDRNPDDPRAEEKFKEIAEAYGVLTDPKKRAQYDTSRQGGFGEFRNAEKGSQGESANGFRYSEEDILRDLFRDPQFVNMFSSILNDFQRAGYRSSQTFVKKSFFSNKGGLLRNGATLVAALAVPAIKSAARSSLKSNTEKLKSFGKRLRRSLGKKFPQLKGLADDSHGGDNQPGPSELDVVYYTPLSAEELREGKTIQVQVASEEGGRKAETLRVHIPPGSSAGKRLRLRGKGHVGGKNGQQRGHIYLYLEKE
ncbi:DnaJ domain-containing protein [Desulforhopalus vacuolatus]|uniref:DnaJ domain-containing protein n=1 Tax=Desulforhopalus vacuolatus TaxID=40414 RepID=UPI001965FB73|nr:DnaJ domain-containing protein [Desulforhopalus vacuolatus]MBM9519662.1 DnaJ domain-containing protein [Desulforhopalus vacuolatus]